MVMVVAAKLPVVVAMPVATPAIHTHRRQGLAPQLASDRVDEQVLKRIPRMARTRPRKYIALNREDDAWVPGKLDGRKARQVL